MQAVLPLIDPLCVTACREAVVFAYHFAFSRPDIVLTGMSLECVGAVCQDICQTESNIYLHFDVDIPLQPSVRCREAAQASIKLMCHHYEKEQLSNLIPYNAHHPPSLKMKRE